MDHAIGPQLLTIGILLIIAYVLGRLGRMVGLPAIPIYMLVGLIASPHFPSFGLSIESADIELIAVFGLILLLFNLGVEFDQEEFSNNAWRLIAAGGSYILINMIGGMAFGLLVGWGTREALIIAGMTATSSSAIVTKLLIELGRLANTETPMILGVTVVEDIFIALYLAIVGVVISGETDLFWVIAKLVVAFVFLVVMFTLARYGGAVVSRLIKTNDDELFTVLFFGLALFFAGVGEQLGVTDAIGAFLIGLVLGATKYRSRIEQIALPMRDIFGAFFFLNFGLTMDPGKFFEVLGPVLVAVPMTFVLNIIAGQMVAGLQRLGPRAGINAAAILVNRGEFALILATIAVGAGLDERVASFAGLYVLIMAILGPIFAGQSERLGLVLFPERRRKKRSRGENAANTRTDGAIAIELLEAVGRDAAPGERVGDGSPVTAEARPVAGPRNPSVTATPGEKRAPRAPIADPLDGPTRAARGDNAQGGDAP